MPITSHGTFLYTLDNDDASVQALRANQNLTETITYTIEDADEDQAMASQTITIQGVDEPPVLSIPNEGTAPAGADLPVVENATVQGSFGINAESGLKTSGTALQLVDEAGDTLQLSFSALQALASVNQTLVGADGTLRLNGYSSSLDTTTINYVFDPKGTQRDHSAGDLSVIQQFTITAIDEQDISTPTRVLDILITDTAPTAALDTNSITEGFSVNVVVGDVTTNDTQGSDTSISVVGIDFNGSKTVGTPFASDYGTLDLNSDGTYTYTLDNGNTAVNNLNNGQSLEEMFTYTIEDTDGDDSSSTLIVTINGGIDDD